jgi:hypothetical protein
MRGWEAFGQKVSLTARIREVLDAYPDDTTIIKEMVQNADDAGAQVVRFVYDRRSHGTQHLQFENFAHYQGPALLVYNDSIFKREDFESIQAVGDSGKKAREEALTGRFGVGFNVVYHVTDVPSFVSDSKIVFFDPHCRIDPSITVANPGCLLDFVENPPDASLHADQYSPFLVFGNTFKKRYDGTIFRLPIRTAEQGRQSQISQKIFDDEAIRRLFERFESEADGMLLFLKTVALVEWYVWEADQTEPTLTFSVGLDPLQCAAIPYASNATAVSSAITPYSQLSMFRGKQALTNLKAARGLLTQIRRTDAGLRAAAGRSQSFLLHIDCVRYPSTFHAISHNSKRSQKWMVCARVGDGQSMELALQESASRRAAGNVAAALVPFGGVALLLSSFPGTSSTDTLTPLAGQAYCFLPLPIATGLPIHINGFFELSLNRRDLWFEAGEQAHRGFSKSKWNVLLMEDVIGRAYALGLAAVAIYQQSHSFSHSGTDAHASPSLFELYPPATGQLALPWRHAGEAAYFQLLSVACLPLMRMGAVSLSLPEGTIDPLQGIVASQEASALLLRLLGNRVALVPSLVAGELQAAARSFQIDLPLLTPGMLRRLLKGRSLVELNDLRRAHPMLLPHASCLQLLEFALSDFLATSSSEKDQAKAKVGKKMLPAEVCQLPQTNEQAFFPLPLLPLMDGSWGCLQFQTAPTTWLVDSLPAQELLQGIAPVLVSHQDLSPPLLHLLQHWSLIANENKQANKNERIPLSLSLSLGTIQSPAVASMLPLVFPPEWNGQLHVRWESSSSSHLYPQQPWLHHSSFLSDFWQHIMPRQPASFTASISASVFSQWPLVPNCLFISADQSCCSLQPQEGYARVVTSLGMRPEMFRVHSPELIEPFARLFILLQLPVVAEDFGRDNAFLTSRTHSLEPRTLLQAVGAMSQEQRAALSQLTAAECSGLLAYLFMSKDFGRSLTERETSILVSLPIWSRVNSCHAPTVLMPRDNFLTLAAAEQFPLPPALLPASVLAHDNNAAILQFLSDKVGIRQLTPSEAFVELLFRRLVELLMLSEADPAHGSNTLPPPILLGDYIGWVNAFLLELPRLHRPESLELEWLRQAAMIPVGEYSPQELSSLRLSGDMLRKPRDLFHPQILAFLGAEGENLLDAASCLPTPALCHPESLSGLSLLGLQRELSLQSLVALAEDLDRKVSLLGANSNSDVAEKGTVDANADADAQAALILRGNALLWHMNEMWRRGDLLSEQDKDKQPSKRHIQAKSLFGRLLAGPKGGSSHSADAKAAEAAQSVLWKRLSLLHWIPVVTEPVERHLPWPSDVHVPHIALGAPNNVAAYELLRYCSLSYRIIRPNLRILPELAEKLGMKTPIEGGSVRFRLSGMVLAHQLLAFGANESAATPAVAVAAEAETESEMNSSGNDDAYGKYVVSTVFPLYAEIAAYLEEKPGSLDQKHIVGLLGKESEASSGSSQSPDASAWIWVGTHFVGTSQVVFSSSVDLRPYLYVIPADLKPFRQLFTLLGVSEYLSLQDAVAVLERIQMQSQQVAAPVAKGPKSGKLSPEDLTLAINLCTFIGSIPRLWEQVERLHLDLLVPTSSHHLMSSTAVLFNDLPWMPPPLGKEILHAGLSSSVSEQLRIRSLRLSVLSADSEGVNVSIEGTESFGQSESLTNRLKHLVDLYPDGPGIFSEFLQNSDDARATEVVFILDARTFDSEQESLLSPRMKALQGPALLVYNNATFSSDDFRNISRIGQGSKKEKLETIGQFGLGFNAVYHVTDVPSFVSGDFMVYFDPHASYLPGATTQQPGLKIHFTRSNVASRFPHQFAPFGLMGFMPDRYYNGTLFRLALRTATMGEQSQIRKSPYSMEDVLQRFEEFAPTAQRALLFLKNVNTVSLRLVRSDEEAATGGTTLFQCTRQLAPGFKQFGGFLTVPTFVAGKQDAPKDAALFFSELASLVQRKKNPPHAVLVLELKMQCPWRDPSSWRQLCTRSDSDAEIATETGIHQLQSQRTYCKRAVVVSCLGNRDSLAFAAKPEHRPYHFVPWGSVGYWLPEEDEENQDEKEDHAKAQGRENTLTMLPAFLQSSPGRVSAFLPLPIASGLPVDISASFALSPNRRELWLGDQMTGSGAMWAEWNMRLLSDAIPRAYALLLLRLAEGDLRQLHPQMQVTGTYSPWPSEDALQVSATFAVIGRHVFDRILDLPVFPPIPSKSILCAVDVLKTHALSPQLLQALTQMLPDASLLLVPHALIVSLLEAGRRMKRNLQQLSPLALLNLLQVAMHTHPEQLAAGLSALTVTELQELCAYTLQTEAALVGNLLPKLPLFRTMAGNVVALHCHDAQAAMLYVVDRRDDEGLVSAVLLQSPHFADCILDVRGLNPAAVETLLTTPELAVESLSPMYMTKLIESALSQCGIKKYLISLENAHRAYGPLGCESEHSLLEWILQFWSWVEHYYRQVEKSRHAEDDYIAIARALSIPFYPVSAGAGRSLSLLRFGRETFLLRASEIAVLEDGLGQVLRQVGIPCTEATCVQRAVLVAQALSVPLTGPTIVACILYLAKEFGLSPPLFLQQRLSLDPLTLTGLPSDALPATQLLLLLCQRGSLPPKVTQLLKSWPLFLHKDSTCPNEGEHDRMEPPSSSSWLCQWGSADGLELAPVEFPLRLTTLSPRHCLYSTPALRHLYEQLAVPTTPMMDFLTEHLAPQYGQLTESERMDDILVVLKEVIPQLEPEAIETLKLLPIFPTVSQIPVAFGELVHPASLIDSDNSLLFSHMKLWQGKVPAAPLHRSPHLERLEELGLAREVSSAMLCSMAADLSHSRDIDKLDSFLQLLAAQSPSMLEEAFTHRQLGSLLQVPILQCSESVTLPAAVSAQLQGWEVEKDIWSILLSEDVGSRGWCALEECIGWETRYLAGAAQPVCALQLPLSLQSQLQWDKTPSLTMVMQHLEALANVFAREKRIQWESVVDESEVSNFMQHCYRELQQTILPRGLLSRALPVFVKGGFVPTAHASFVTELALPIFEAVRGEVVEGEGQAAASLPLLHLIPVEMAESFRDVYTACGVKLQFALEDYLGWIDRVYRQGLDHQSRELPESYLQSCLQVFQTMALSMNSNDGAEEEKVAEIEDDGREALVMKTEEDQGFDPMEIYLLAQVEPVLLTQSNRLEPASSLCVNDAPWLSAQAENLLLLHPSIAPNLATALGASLLTQKVLLQDKSQGKFQSIPCPLAHHHHHDEDDDSSQTERSRSNDQDEVLTPWQRIARLIGLLDAMGATSVKLVLDESSYAKEALLLPGLDVLQGPALVLIAPGLQMNENDLVHWLISPPQIGCWDISAAFGLSDYLQVLSSNYLAMFDPLDRLALTQLCQISTATTPPSSVRRPEKPAALSYRWLGNDRSYPDQLRPFEPFTRLSGGCADLVLRLPLRTQSSSLGGVLALAGLWDELSTLEGLLLLSRHLVKAEAQFLPANRNPSSSSSSSSSADASADATPMSLQHCSAKIAVAVSEGPKGREARERAFADTSYRSFHLFGFKPSIYHYQIQIKCFERMGTAAPQLLHQHDWAICQVVGAGESKDLAKADKSKRLHPLGGCALQLGKEMVSEPTYFQLAQGLVQLWLRRNPSSFASTPTGPTVSSSTSASSPAFMAGGMFTCQKGEAALPEVSPWNQALLSCSLLAFQELFPSHLAQLSKLDRRSHDDRYFGMELVPVVRDLSLRHSLPVCLVSLLQEWLLSQPLFTLTKPRSDRSMSSVSVSVSASHQKGRKAGDGLLVSQATSPLLWEMLSERMSLLCIPPLLAQNLYTLGKSRLNRLNMARIQSLWREVLGSSPEMALPQFLQRIQPVLAHAAREEQLAYMQELVLFIFRLAEEEGRWETLPSLLLLPIGRDLFRDPEAPSRVTRIAAGDLLLGTAEEAGLIPGMARSFVDPTVGLALWQQLWREQPQDEMERILRLRRFSLASLPPVLAAYLPPQWKHRSSVPWDPSTSTSTSTSSSVPSLDWICRLWSFLAGQKKAVSASLWLSVLEELSIWPLIPCHICLDPTTGLLSSRLISCRLVDAMLPLLPTHRHVLQMESESVSEKEKDKEKEKEKGKETSFSSSSSSSSSETGTWPVLVKALGLVGVPFPYPQTELLEAWSSLFAPLAVIVPNPVALSRGLMLQRLLAALSAGIVPAYAVGEPMTEMRGEMKDAVGVALQQLVLQGLKTGDGSLPWPEGGLLGEEGGDGKRAEAQRLRQLPLVPLDPAGPLTAFSDPATQLLTFPPQALGGYPLLSASSASSTTPHQYRLAWRLDLLPLYRVLAVRRLEDEVELLCEFGAAEYGADPHQAVALTHWMGTQWLTWTDAQKEQVKEALLPFVVVENAVGEVVAPRALLSPTVPLFQQVFPPQSPRFPGEMQSAGMIALLGDFGMRLSVDDETLLWCARSVEMRAREYGRCWHEGQSVSVSGTASAFAMPEAELPALVAASEAIALHVASTMQHALSRDSIRVLSTISCLACRDPTQASRIIFAAYNQCATASLWPLVSQIKPALPATAWNPPPVALSWMGMTLSVDASLLQAQIRALSATSPASATAMGALEMVLRRRRSGSSAANSGSHGSCISRNESLLLMDETAMSGLEFSLKLWTMLADRWDAFSDEDRQWIAASRSLWINEELVNCTRLYSGGSAGLRELRPFFFRLPTSYGEFGEKLRHCGVSDTIGWEKVMVVLHSYAGTVLDPNALSSCLHLLTLVAERMGTRDASTTRTTGAQLRQMPNVTLPDTHGRLRLRKELLWIDRWDIWERLARPGVHLSREWTGHPLHASIGRDGATFFGVEFLSQRFGERILSSSGSGESLVFGESLELEGMLEQMLRAPALGSPVLLVRQAADLKDWEVSIVEEGKELMTSIVHVPSGRFIQQTQKAVPLCADVTPHGTVLYAALSHCSKIEICKQLAVYLSTRYSLPHAAMRGLFSAFVEIAENVSLSDLATSFEEAQFGPTPGARVRQKDESLLHLCTLDDAVQEGDIVAVVNEPGDMVYGIVSQVVKENGDDQVVPLRKFWVNVGEEEDGEFLSSIVYVYGSHLQSVVPVVPLSAPTHAGPAPTDALSEQKKKSFSEEDTVLAATELLSRVDVNVSSDKKELWVELARRKDAEKLAKKRLEELEAELRQTKSRMEQLEEKQTCPICLTEYADRVVVPCGHRFCHDCVSRLERDSCPTCRTPAQSVVRFF